MRVTALALAAFALAVPALATPAVAADTDWKRVDEVLGRPGADQPGGVHKFGLPRTDLRVTLDGVAIEPALALGSWLAFQPAGGGDDGDGRPRAHSGGGEPGHEPPRRGRDRDHRAAQPPPALPAGDDVHARRGAGRPGAARAGAPRRAGAERDAAGRAGEAVARRGGTGSDARHGRD